MIIAQEFIKPKRKKLFLLIDKMKDSTKYKASKQVKRAISYSQIKITNLRPKRMQLQQMHLFEIKSWSMSANLITILIFNFNFQIIQIMKICMFDNSISISNFFNFWNSVLKFGRILKLKKINFTIDFFYFLTIKIINTIILIFIQNSKWLKS